MSKATVTNPTGGDSWPKGQVIPSDVESGHPHSTKGVNPPWDGPSWYQLDGEVTAHHG